MVLGSNESKVLKISRISPLTDNDRDGGNGNVDTNDNCIVVWKNVDRSDGLAPGVLITKRGDHSKILQWHE